MAPNSGNPHPPTSLSPEFSFRTRQQIWDQLQPPDQHIYNVVIIGGGIVGAGILREMALQTIPDVLLVEKSDFASATSGASSKLIHAGIRYLEQVWNALKRFQLGVVLRNFRFVLEASQERKILGQIAPHLVKPKPIFLVLAKKDRRASLSVLMGVWFYYVIQLCQGQFFPRPQCAFSKKAIHALAPDIDADKVKAVFSFWDSETDDARLTIEVLQSAHEYGTHAMNYVELIKYKRVGDQFEVTLKNRENNEDKSIATKILVNATGPFVDEMKNREEGGSTEGTWLDRIAGSHLDVYPKITDDSYYITAGDERLVFILKRHEDGLEYSRIGTTERPLKENESSENPEPTQPELDYLKGLVKEFFPQADLSDNHVIRTDAGIRPLKTQKSAAFAKSREHEIIEDRGLYHMISVKLTDFRRVSWELMTKIPWKDLNLAIKDPKRTQKTPLRPQASESMYEEGNMEEVARRTMLLHWKDYLSRRRGLKPILDTKTDPTRSEKEFQTLSQILHWDEPTQNREK